MFKLLVGDWIRCESQYRWVARGLVVKIEGVFVSNQVHDSLLVQLGVDSDKANDTYVTLRDGDKFSSHLLSGMFIEEVIFAGG